MSKAAKKCILCKMTLDDPVKLGEFKTHKSISAHYYCLLLTTQLLQKGSDNQGILGFLPEDIRTEERRIRDQVCYYCCKPSANLACCAPKCYKVFHLYCGLENLAICHFKDDYRTICSKHHTTERKKCTKNDECVICCESMGSYSRVLSIIAPCCRSGWFHKWCIAKFALSAGYFFKCPLCNNRDVFRSRLVHKGIFVPDQDATWELDPNAFADLLVRPKSCSADKCRCPRGRSYRHYPYHLITCETCGSSAAHSLCMEQPSQIYNCSLCIDILKIATPAPPTPSAIPEDVAPKSESDEAKVEVVELDEDKKDWLDDNYDNENDNDSVDSLLITFVRRNETKDDARVQSSSSTDLSGDSVLFNDRESISVNYIGNYQQNEISDEDINLIYRSVRKRKSSLRRENSEQMAVSPKRLKGSSSSVDSMLFDHHTNKLFDVSDNEVERNAERLSNGSIKTEFKEDCDQDFVAKLNSFAPLTSKNLRNYRSPSLDSCADIELIVSSEASEDQSVSSSRNKRLKKSSRKSDASKTPRRTKDRVSRTHNKTIVRRTDDNSQLTQILCTNESRPAPIDTRRRSARLNPLKETSLNSAPSTPVSPISVSSISVSSTPVSLTPIPSPPIPLNPTHSTTTARSSRMRSRAKSTCLELSKRKNSEDERTDASSLPKMRLRSKSVCAVRTEPVRRSMRLQEKPFPKIYKDELIYVTELEGDYMKRQPFSEKEILHLFVKRNSCDNRIRQHRYDETFKENMDSRSLKKPRRDISVDSCEEFSASSSMLVYDPSMQPSSCSDTSDSSMLSESIDLESSLQKRVSCEIEIANMPQTFFEF